MSVSTQPSVGNKSDRFRTISYQPKSRLLILEFPREGAYLYHNVPVGTYEMLRHSPLVRASFLRGRHHRYSVVTTA